MLLRILVLFTLVLPLSAGAQSLDLMENASSPFSLSVSPQYPTPYSEAVLSMVSGSVALANTTITVVAGGKELYRGSAKPVKIQLGRAGSPVTARVSVSGSSGTFTQSVTIVPQDVAIIAEPLASAPVLYPGKPLVPLEGRVRLVAVANLRTAAGAVISPATASYLWTVDGVQMANLSGIGKMAVTVASPLQYRELTVNVAVTSADGTLVGGATLSLAGNPPLVRMYENDPLLGIRFDRAIRGRYTIAGTEASLYAAPFSFPTTAGAPLVQWFLNGELAQTGNSVTLRPTGSGQGGAKLSLVASTDSSIKALADLSLTFGASTSGFNLFGL